MNSTLARTVPAIGLCLLLSLHESALARANAGEWKLHYRNAIQQWTGVAHLNRWQWNQGDVIRIPFSVDSAFPLLAKQPDEWDGLLVVLWGERLYDDQGRYRQESNFFMSGFLTCSGLPVENHQWDPPVSALKTQYRSPIEASLFYPKKDLKFRGDDLHLEDAFNVAIPSDCPSGLYRFHLEILVRTTAGPAILDLGEINVLLSPELASTDSSSISLPSDAMDDYHNIFFHNTFLPPVRIGQPAQPKMIMAILSDRVTMGMPAILSKEDSESFALSPRTTHCTSYINYPSYQPLAVCPVASCPQRVAPMIAGGGFFVPPRIDDYIDYKHGMISYVVTYPDGRTIAVKDSPLQGVKDGLLTWKDDAVLDFRQPGRYEVVLKGWTDDVVGATYSFGGTYEFYRAVPMSFSTAAKLGSSFFVGNKYPPKVQLHPFVPGYVREIVRYFPQSDVNRRREIMYEGYANSFGYFLPPPGSPPMIFDEPGEYRVDILAAYQEPNGNLWMGAQTAAGVVAEPDPEIELHGLKMNIFGLDDNRPDHGLQARYRLHEEDSLMTVMNFDVSNCHNTPPPYFSGDVLHLASTLDGSSSLATNMSEAIKPAELRDEILQKLPTEYFLTNQNLQGITAKPRFHKGIMRLEEYSDATFTTGDSNPADQLPIMSWHRSGWNPYNYPEGSTILNYYYYTAIRPGFPACTIVSDSSCFKPFWYTSPNSFANHFNAGPNGDIAQDLYRVDAGLVYVDTATGRHSYAAYTGAVIIDLPETYAKRVVEPCEEPLFSVMGRDCYIFLAVEAAALLQPGDPLALAAQVFPPVPADVEMTLTTPSGSKQTVSGKANSLGIFSKPESVVKMSEPGVYRVASSVEYKGRMGGAFGKEAGEYFHFVVEPGRERILKLNLAGRTPCNPMETINFPLSVKAGITGLTLTWSVVCTGIVMDAGQMPLHSTDHTFRFIPTQFATEFPNYQLVNFDNGEAAISKTTILTFFVEGNDATGNRVCDVEYAIIRGRTIYVLPTDLTLNEASKKVITG